MEHDRSERASRERKDVDVCREPDEEDGGKGCVDSGLLRYRDDAIEH